MSRWSSKWLWEQSFQWSSTEKGLFTLFLFCLKAKQETRVAKFSLCIHKHTSLHNTDKFQIQTDVYLMIQYSSRPPSTDDFNSQLRSVLDGHSPVTCCKVTQHKSTPWYSPAALRLRALTMEGHWVEHQWFMWYKMTVHKQSSTCSNTKSPHLLFQHRQVWQFQDSTSQNMQKWGSWECFLFHLSTPRIRFCNSFQTMQVFFNIFYVM